MTDAFLLLIALCYDTGWLLYGWFLQHNQCPMSLRVD